MIPIGVVVPYLAFDSLVVIPITKPLNLEVQVRKDGVGGRSNEVRLVNKQRGLVIGHSLEEFEEGIYASTTSLTRNINKFNLKGKFFRGFFCFVPTDDDLPMKFYATF